MTTEEQSTQETTEAEKPKSKRSRAKAPAESQSEQTPEVEQPEINAANLEFGQVLQEQIAQAVQPVLAEFRQQVARAVEEQLESEPAPGRNGDKLEDASNASPPEAQHGDNTAEGNSPSPAAPSQQAENAPEASAAGSDGGEQQGNASAATQPQGTSNPASGSVGEQQTSAPQSHEQSGGPQQPESQEQSSGQPQEEPQAQLSPSDGSESEESQSKTPSAPRRLLTGGLHLAEQQGERWLQSMVAAGLTSLLAESSQAAAQQRAEQELHGLLTKAFQAAPAGTLSEDLQGQIERTLQAILRDTIAALFSENVRTSIVDQSSSAVGAAVHGDVGTVRSSLQSAAMTIVDELVRVLRHQWQRILRLLLKAVMAALENAVGSDDDNVITSTTKKALGTAGGAV